jgi:hypothetical protein
VPFDGRHVGGHSNLLERDLKAINVNTYKGIYFSYLFGVGPRLREDFNLILLFRFNCLVFATDITLNGGF